MDLSDWSSIAQITVAVLTLIGIVTSLYVSTKALREVQLDRKLRQTPYLAFEPGGHTMAVHFVKAGKYVPGVNPKYAHQVFRELPSDAESVRIKGGNGENHKGAAKLYGGLRNYGLGPSLHTHITWVPDRIHFGTEEFELNASKLSEPKYSRDLNYMPSIPEHILPGQTAQLSRLPTFIEKDVEKRITQVTGVLLIECLDVFKQKHTVSQGFYLSTDYQAEAPSVHVTFLDIQDL